MPLTDTAIRNAKPRERDYKLADGAGLYLLVTSAGGRLWRLKYRVDGIERKLSIGKYPAVSLSNARRARDSARSKASAGDDPAAAKRRERVKAKLAAGTTFGAVALEYISKAEREGRAPATVTKLHWARDWLQSAIGHRPVDQVEPHELLAVLRRQEASGNLETARRTRAFASCVFRYAVATARAKGDPAALLLGAIVAPQPKHLAAIIDGKRAGDLLRAIAGYTGQPVTRIALALAPHVFVRPGVTSIDLTENSVTETFSDGSTIDGETTFTKTDGTTGTVASVTYAAEANGYSVETVTTVNADGSTTVDNIALNGDGSLANETIETTSADGLSRTLQYDDAGNGIIDQTQTDVTVVNADGCAAFARTLRGHRSDHARRHREGRHRQANARKSKENNNII